MQTESASRGRKLDRLRLGGQPRLLDLFSGCGGMTVGFTAEGFRSVGGVENDPHAAASYALNFHSGHDQAHFAVARDISTVDIAEVLQCEHHEVEDRVDVVVGGPPCPTFTRVGRAKLREVMDHPEAFKLDPRTSLYMHALRVVSETQPVAVLIENVPDVLNQGGRSVGDEIAEHLDLLGYSVTYGLLNAVHYGVPQMRDRFFLMAIAKEASTRPSLPVRTHSADLPRGYEGSRDVALRLLGDLSRHPYYSDPTELRSGLAPAVSAEEAIGDLPPITEHLGIRPKKGPKRLNLDIPHAPNPERSSDYARLMQGWPGFEHDGFLHDHVTRALGLRDQRIFSAMKPGDEYPEAHALAVGLWQGAGADPQAWAEYVPPYDETKFPNKWRKIEANQPARTLMAHLGKDGYSHIHYDSSQARTISVREAARLQSFPDGFRFSGTLNPGFRQIGNAVAPLMARALAHQFAIGLELPVGRDERAAS